MFALLAAITALFAWQWTRDPRIMFLSGDRRAQWILFPSAPDTASHPLADLDTLFRRGFTLERKPSAGRLSIRAATRFQLVINGVAVAVPRPDGWKEASTADVSAQLQPGTNEIEVRVFNDRAPPALWL